MQPRSGAKLRWAMVAGLALASVGASLHPASAAGNGLELAATLQAIPIAVQEEPDEAANQPAPSLQIVRAAPPQAAIIAIPKGASLLRADKPVPTATRGTVLRQGDVLQNGPAGTLDLRLGDLATLRLEPGARIRLTTLLRPMAGRTGGRDTWLRLDAGSLLVRLRGGVGASRLVLETSTAVIAANGSAYVVRVGKPGTTLLVTEGEADVSLATDPASTSTVSAHERVQVQKHLPIPEAADETDRPRLDAMKQLCDAVDAETAPLLVAVDALLVAGKLVEAERQADYVVGRAWGRGNAVRAHARYLDALRKRVGSVHLAGAELLGLDQTVLAWYRALPSGAETGLQASVDQSFRTDPAARRWTLVWIATLHAASGPVDTMPDRVMQLGSAEGADEVVRTECLALAALAIQDRNERGRTEELLRQATVLLEAVQADSNCDQVLQMKALARLLFWPESRAQRTPAQRKLDATRLLQQAEKAPHGWGYYFAAGALQTLGRELEAAPYVARFFDDPHVRSHLEAHPGFALPWAEQLADSLRAKGEKHHAREIWRLLARRYQNNPQIVDRASDELLAIGL